MAKTSEAKLRANKKYFAKAYKQVKLAMPNAEAERLTEFCKTHNLTKAGLIRRLLTEYMDRVESEESENSAK